jgi:hypothetical protein
MTQFCTSLVRHASVLACLFAVSLTAAHADTPERMPRGAFLRHPANSTSRLAAQVKADPVVCGRYARLFHLSPQMVQLAMGSMRLKRLAEDHVLAVHYVHPGEKIGYKLSRVKKGTLIYALPDGTPALVEVCGNPLRMRIEMPDARPQPHVAMPQAAPIASEQTDLASTRVEPELDSVRDAAPAAMAAEAPVVAPLPAPVTAPAAAIPAEEDVADDTPAETETSGSHTAPIPGYAWAALAGAAPLAGLSGDWVEARDALPIERVPGTPPGMTQRDATSSALNTISDFVNGKDNESVFGGGSGSGAGGGGGRHGGSSISLPALQPSAGGATDSTGTTTPDDDTTRVPSVPVPEDRHPLSPADVPEPGALALAAGALLAGRAALRGRRSSQRR